MARMADDDGDFDVRSPRRRRTSDFVMGGVLVVAAGAITTNALFLQNGQHPAPFFVNRVAAPAPAYQPALTPTVVPNVVLPRPRPTEQTDAPAPAAAAPIPAVTPPAPIPAARSQTDIVIEIQKELGRRGFYDGVADGVYGPKTDGAIRDFMQAANLKIGADPNEALLQAIVKAPAKIKPLPAATAAPADVPRPPDPIGEMIAPPAKRVMAVQRVLAEYGYGQIKPTGVLDRDTQDAIEQFERARKIPVTRQISPRLMKELAAMSGRPID